MNEAVRLPAVTEPKLPVTIPVSVNARAQRAGLFSTTVDVDVENHGPSPLICDIRGRTRSREIEMQPGYVWIDPNTTGTLHVRVGMRVPIVHTVVVRLRDNVREYLAETVVARPAAMRTVPILAAFAVLAGVLAWMVLALHPRIDALSAPPRVMAGDRVDVAYAAHGLGKVDYSISRDGTAVGGGTLPAGSGTLRFVTDRLPAQYRIVLRISGPAGSATQSQTVSSQAPPPVPIVAEIHALDAQPPVAASGARIVARYAAAAQSGTVRLLDMKGTPWDAAPYSKSGSTPLHAPHVDAPRHFVIQLNVRNGDSIAVASTGVEVLPQPSPSASPSENPSGMPPTPPPAAVGNVTTNPPYVVSGTYFTVALHGAASKVVGRASLESAAGTPLQSAPVAPGLDAKFIAPSVRRATTFYVMVSATHDRTGQLVIVPVLIHPS